VFSANQTAEIVACILLQQQLQQQQQQQNRGKLHKDNMHITTPESNEK